MTREENRLIDKFAKIRENFPILNLTKNEKKLVYFDNAATTQKPINVINRLVDYYSFENSNVHRGVHLLSDNATTNFESARECVKKFIGARSAHEVIFTKGTTESINLVASCFAKTQIKEGDEIIISTVEHHANIVPWQEIALKYRAKIKIIPINEFGEWDLEETKKLFSSRTKLVSISHVSNASGIINPIEVLIDLAKSYNACTLIDGAQAISHLKIDVKKLDVDFYAFSAHKLYGPTGVGVIYGKEEWLEKLPPYQYGGEMIKSVSFKETIYNDLPYKFESGTPNIAGVIATQTAIEYFITLGYSDVLGMESILLNHLLKSITTLSNVNILGGNTKHKAPIISFNIAQIHPYDIGFLLNQHFIALRTGNHCAQPLMDTLNLKGTARASLAFYNTLEEIDFFVSKLDKAINMLSK